MPAWRTLLLTIFAGFLAACGSPEPRGPVVLAAASLQEVMEEIADSWQAEGHARPVLSFAGTPSLARQVENGAPADLVIAADTQWIDYLDRSGLLQTATIGDIAGNRLVVVTGRVPGASQAGASAADLEVLLAQPGARLAVGEPQSVPAGRYAEQALTNLGLWQAVQGRIVPTDNVRTALALAARGEAQFAVVYASDAAASPDVLVVARLPDASHAPVRYRAAVVDAATHQDALAFRAYLAGETSQQAFLRHGFSLVSKGEDE